MARSTTAGNPTIQSPVLVVTASLVLVTSLSGTPVLVAEAATENPMNDTTTTQTTKPTPKTLPPVVPPSISSSSASNTTTTTTTNHTTSTTTAAIIAAQSQQREQEQEQEQELNQDPVVFATSGSSDGISIDGGDGKKDYIGAIVYSVTFGLLLLAHIYFMLRRCRLFLLFAVLACIGECMGWVCLTVEHYKPQTKDVAQIAEYTLAFSPALILARLTGGFVLMFRRIAPRLSPLSPNVFTALFLLFSIVALAIIVWGEWDYLNQSKVTSKGKKDHYKDILIAAFSFEAGFNAIFLIYVIYWWYKLSKNKKKYGYLDSGERTVMYGLVLASIAVLVRDVYRALRVGLTKKPKLKEPIYLICLDGLPIALALLITVVAHPSIWLLYRDDYYKKQKRGRRNMLYENSEPLL